MTLHDLEVLKLNEVKCTVFTTKQKEVEDYLSFHKQFFTIRYFINLF